MFFRFTLKHIVLLFLFLVPFASCTKNDDVKDEEEIFTFSRIVGKWEMTAFKTDGYFIPTESKEHFIFLDDKTYIRDVDGWVTQGTFTFNPNANLIVCKESRGWNLQILVEFTGEDSAIFHITGRTQTFSEVIKVQRK